MKFLMGVLMHQKTHFHDAPMRQRLSSLLIRNCSLKRSSFCLINAWKRLSEPQLSFQPCIVCTYGLKNPSRFTVRWFASEFADDDDDFGSFLYDDFPHMEAKKRANPNHQLTHAEVEQRLLLHQQLQEKFQIGVQNLLNAPLPCQDPRAAILTIRGFMHEYHMLKSRDDTYVLALNVHHLTQSAVRKALDILHDILEQKALSVAPTVQDMEENATQPPDEYISDVENSVASTVIEMEEDAIWPPLEYVSDVDDDDSEMEWCYDARILFNPLLQIWHHNSLAAVTAPPTDATLTPDQVREKLQSMIRHMIDYTAHTNPSLLVQHLPHQTNNPRTVDFKFFYNSMTLNMIFDVLLHQYVPQEEEASEILQRYFSETNEFIMNCLRAHVPDTPEEEDADSEVEEPFIPTMTNDEDDSEQSDEEEMEDDFNMWDEEEQQSRLMKGAIPTDARGNIILPDEQNADFTGLSPNRIDASGLGIRVSPDVNTYNVFLKAWATKCSNLPLASRHMHKIYQKMHQAGNELTPTHESYSLILQFYSSHPDRFVHRLNRLILYLAEKEGIRNVQLAHWYYAIVGCTQIRKHKAKAKEYWENMMNSDHHPWKNGTVGSDNPSGVFLHQDGHDIESITILQKGAQHLMGMYRSLVVHHFTVARSARQMGQQGPKTMEKALREMELWMRCGLDTYTKLKDSGLLEYADADENIDLVYRDQIRATLMEIFAYSGQLEHAKTTFKALVYRTALHYQTLIDAYGKYDNITGAEDMYIMMVNDPSIAHPSLDVYTALMRGYANSTKYPPEKIVDCIMDVVRRLGQEEKCIQHGVVPDRSLYHELLKCLSELPAACDAHRCEGALSILNTLEENLVMFGPHNDEDAINAQVVIPNKQTYFAVVRVCLQARDFDLALSIVKRMARTPIPAPIPKKRFLNYQTSFELFQMYRELKTVEAFEKMIDLLSNMKQWYDQKFIPFRLTASTYNVVFQTGCDVRHQDSKSADTLMKQLFQQMREEGVKPTNSTYIALIESLCQSQDKNDLNVALELYNEYERQTSFFQKSDDRIFMALIQGFLRLDETNTAVQVLLWYVKATLMDRISVRPVGTIYRKIILSYMKSKELIKAAMFVEQIHILQKTNPPRKDVKGVTVKLDERGIPTHIGPDVVTLEELLKAIKASKSISYDDKEFYKAMLKKHMEAIKRFHKRRQKIVRETF